MGIRWAGNAARAARERVRAFRSENSGAQFTIFATFPPLGTLLAGRQLSRAEGIPWIADFRDPMDGQQPARGKWWQRSAYLALERAMMRSARAVIANTDAAQDMLRKKYPAAIGKIHAIWNGFDPDDRLAALPRVSSDFRVLSHTGELYAGRTAAPILESIARLISRDRLAADGVRVRLVGDVEDGSLPDGAFLGRAHAQGWLELVPERITRQEALRIAQSSDYLLLLQSQSSTQVPGKLFEYLLIGRPILAYLQRDSPCGRVLARSGVPYRCVYTGDTAPIVDDTVAEFFRMPSAAVQASAWFAETFDVRRQTCALESVLQSLHGGAGDAAHPERRVAWKEKSRKAANR